MSDQTGLVHAGDIYLMSPFGVEEPANPSGNPFRYTGRRYDPETGLYHYRARIYDPDWGRFLQTDPVGYADQMNLYAYVYNDPINGTDPTGKCGPATPYCVAVGANVARQGAQYLARAAGAAALTYGVSRLAQARNNAINDGFRGSAVYNSAHNGGHSGDGSPPVQRGVGDNGPPPDPDIGTVLGGAVLIGMDNFGTKELADSGGATTFVGQSDFQTSILTAIADPNQALAVNLDGLSGATTAEQISNAISSGRLAEATGNLAGNATNWEIYKIDEAGRLGETTFIRNGREVENPFR